MLRIAIRNKRLIASVGTIATATTIVSIYPSGKPVFLEKKITTEATASSDITPKILPSRKDQLSKLSSGKVYDVLVVGGGATGCGAALDAQMRGLDTALIERGDFSSETSSRSTKLIWAGIRYIATGIASLLRFRNLSRPLDAIGDFKSEFAMVMGAHRERRLLLENNPHLTNWVPIAVPMKTWTIWPAPMGHPLFCVMPMVLPGVFKFYDSLSGFTCPPSHLMSKTRSVRKFPQLDDDFKYVSIFYEGQHNDSRTATCIGLTAAEEGATVANYTEMVGTIHEGGGKTGKVVGIKVRDNVSGEVFDVHAKAIVFAGGPFTDQLRRIEDPDCKPAVNGAAGTHIVLPGYYAPDGVGLLDMNTSDGRFLFLLPWQGHTLVGTTDRKGDAVSTPLPPEDEINWILSEVERYLSPELKVRRADVLSAWQGFRPLASDPNAPPGAPASRDHVISTNPETGITFITGGKWTTYREMAEDVINRVIKLNGLSDKAGPCKTDERPLRGGVGYTKNNSVRLIQEFGVSEATAKHLSRTYGVNAIDVCRSAKPTGKSWPRFGNLLIEGFPYLECEIDWVCKNEMVVSVKDMLTIRTRLAFLNSEAAKNAAPRVSQIMGKTLNWSRKEEKKQLEDALAYLSEFGGPVPSPEIVKLSLATITDIKEIFQTFDNDKSGYIDFAEMMLMADKLGFPLTKEEGVKTFQKIDLDGDGRLTEEEFAHWWNEAGPDDKLRKQLGMQFRLSSDKLASGGSDSRGVMFG